MAHLLGSKFCIESLRNDVTDLQEAVTDVFSRVGPVRQASWKYPDKISADVDMTELLELYDYSDDEEERQVAHIVLLELVIDRLVLLLQAMAKYLEQINSTGKAGASAKNTSNSSIGLVVKKYWSKMVAVHSLVQQLQSESKSKNRRVYEVERELKRLDIELDQVKSENSCLNTTLSGVGIPLNGANSSLSSTGHCTISRDESNKACQTVETAFVPCESCHLVQRSFREVGDLVISVCQTQSLPSSLSKHRSKLEGTDWLSGNDVAYWASEQSKDLARINKHLEFLLGTIEPLKSDLQREKTRTQELKEKVSSYNKELKLERETQSAQIRNYEGKLKSMEGKTQDALGAAKREKEAILQAKAELEKQLARMKDELNKQHQLMSQLESGKVSIQRQLDESLVNREQVRALEADITAMQNQLSQVTSQLDVATKDLQKERAKTKSVNKHAESLQGKQGALLERLDMLDQENEEMRSQVAELEEARESLEDSLERVEQQRRDMIDRRKEDKVLIERLTADKEQLEQSMEELKQDIMALEQKVQEAREHEQLLVAYPDLNGPVNHDVAGTGDLSRDMENQVKANSIRIQVLEEQNLKLRRSITKMLQTQASRAEAQLTHPIPLWKNPADDQEPVPANKAIQRNNQSRHGKKAFAQPRPSTDSSPDPSPDTDHSSSPAEYDNAAPHATSNFPPRPPKREDAKPRNKEGVFLVGRGSRSGPGPTLRPQSGRGDSISVYSKLKKAGKIRPSSSSMAEQTEPNYQEMHVCHKCDKMYTSARDLEVHKSYCFGGI